MAKQVTRIEKDAAEALLQLSESRGPAGQGELGAPASRQRRHSHQANAQEKQLCSDQGNRQTSHRQKKKQKTMTESLLEVHKAFKELQRLLDDIRSGGRT
ncbi:hypothetical protein PYW07_005261 [Mythimna separata]|uniref:Uncharacterized protein n=1 Tax=Mythimna separata TaxID=271217 RepID=A0AAD8DPT1_MYTSE|nr:hypothetical protein PYW07_005261 [Mythimna separata]